MDRLARITAYIVCDLLASGQLVRVLKDHPNLEMESVALYPHCRYMTAKARVFIDMLVERFAGACSGQTGGETAPIRKPFECVVLIGGTLVAIAWALNSVADAIFGPKRSTNHPSIGTSQVSVRLWRRIGLDDHSDPRDDPDDRVRSESQRCSR
jgi:hypothetical protein